MRVGDFWVGWSDVLGYVIHDNLTPLEPNRVYLWVVSRNGPERFDRTVARSHLRPVPLQERAAALAIVTPHLERFTEFQKERLKNERDEAAAREREQAARETWCWNCGSPLTSLADAKCGICGWLICGCCSACGCGYSQREADRQVFNVEETPFI